MAHFNFVISQNAKWGHAGFYIDRHRMTSSKYAYRKVLFYKKSTACNTACRTKLTDNITNKDINKNKRVRAVD